MTNPIRRREILKLLGTGAVTVAFGDTFSLSQDSDLRIAGLTAQASITPVSQHTSRITLVAKGARQVETVPQDGALVLPTALHPSVRTNLEVTSPDPLNFVITTAAGRVVQNLRIDRETGVLTFLLGDGPVLGLGEGGPQFDRRGEVDRMRSGQGGYQLRTHGGRVPIQWLIGTSGWAMFIHSPLGSFDLSGEEGRFIPPEGGSLPLDIFVVDAADPQTAMAEYARITELPGGISPTSASIIERASRRRSNTYMRWDIATLLLSDTTPP